MYAIVEAGRLVAADAAQHGGAIEFCVWREKKTNRNGNRLITPIRCTTTDQPHATYATHFWDGYQYRGAHSFWCIINMPIS